MEKRSTLISQSSFELPPELVENDSLDSLLLVMETDGSGPQRHHQTEFKRPPKIEIDDSAEIPKRCFSKNIDIPNKRNTTVQSRDVSPIIPITSRSRSPSIANSKKSKMTLLKRKPTMKNTVQ